MKKWLFPLIITIVAGVIVYVLTRGGSTVIDKIKGETTSDDDVPDDVTEADDSFTPICIAGHTYQVYIANPLWCFLDRWSVPDDLEGWQAELNTLNHLESLNSLLKATGGFTTPDKNLLLLEITNGKHEPGHSKYLTQPKVKFRALKDVRNKNELGEKMHALFNCNADGFGVIWGFPAGEDEPVGGYIFKRFKELS